MKHRIQLLPAGVIFLALLAPVSARAQQPSAPSQVIAVAPANPLAGLLTDRLAGIAATGEITHVENNRLAELVSDKATAYQEYRVSAAASRQYGPNRVDVFQTRNDLAAFGLFTFSSGGATQTPDGLGSGGAVVDGVVIFWKDHYFVRVTPSDPARARPAAAISLARAVARAIVTGGDDVARPALLDSLPASQMIAGSERYFLGPDSLGAYVERAREMFEFPGDAEAVLAEYKQAAPADPLNQPANTAAISNTSAGAGTPGGLEAPAPLKVLIVEYHTPQFATDAVARLGDFVESLPEEEQTRILFQREGNYVIEAINVTDRELAQGLIGSIKYPYTVKWLRNPLWPTNDPFRMQKTAQMLISTFGLLGLMLLTVLGVGSVFGATIFLKRRKRQQEVFSDAGGMLRLEIESTLLGLPPKRSGK